jgi:hypothetical protein
MDAEVVRITRDRFCEARLPNEILVVFPEPTDHPIHLGDRLRFQNLRLDAQVRVENLTQRVEFVIHLKANDVHDLRLPVRHGGSRTPTLERLHGP